MNRPILIISSYPYDKCGVSSYTKKLITELEHNCNIETFTIKLTREGLAKYLLKSAKLLYRLLQGDYELAHFEYTPTILGPLFPAYLFAIRLRGKKSITTIHENISVYTANRPAIIRSLLSAYESSIIGLSSKIILISNSQRQELRRRHAWLHESKTVVIPMGIQPYHPTTSNKSNIAPTVGFFGFIKPGKGLETFAAASKLVLEKMPDTKILISGAATSDSYLESLKKLFKPLAGHVKWINFLPDNEMWQVMNGCSCVVLPYDKSTNSGILADTVTAEVPVVATDVGSFKEIIEQWHIGKTCQPGDATGLSEAIVQTASSKRTQQTLISHIKLLKNANSWQVIAKMHLAIYENRLNMHRTRSFET